MQLLQIAQLLNVLLKQLLILLLAFAIRIHDRRPLAQIDVFVGRNTKVFGVYGHDLLSLLLEVGKSLTVGFVLTPPVMDAPALA